MDIKKILPAIPAKPGVYLMKDAGGKTIYVGKAKSLKNRVRSYFSGRSGDVKVSHMIRDVVDIDYIVTKTELEAIFLEARLIKDIRPKYNVRLKDDKSFSYLVTTDYDDFPKVWVVHETDEIKGSRYGPFPSSLDLKKAIQALQKVFRFATCSLTIREDDKPGVTASYSTQGRATASKQWGSVVLGKQRRYFRPCLLYHIKQCSAPCTTSINKREYNQDIRNFLTFLGGDKEALLSKLEAKMKLHSEMLNFERAAVLRDQIDSLKSIDDLFKKYIPKEGVGPISPKDANAGLNMIFSAKETTIYSVEALDISHLSGEWAVGSIVRFVEGVPFKPGYRRYRIKTVKGIDDYAMVREVVSRRVKRGIKNGDLPELLLIDGGIGQLNAAKEALEQCDFNKEIQLVALAKKEETIFHPKYGKMEISRDNLGLRLLMYARDEAHRFAKNYNVKLRKKSALG